MTKQEQIEEMAKIIDNRLIEARGYLGSMNRGEGYWVAQKLIEHYQLKLPEDSVVLSREEYEMLANQYKALEIKYNNLSDNYRLCKDANETLKRNAIAIRKETAKEILLPIYELCKVRGTITFDDLYFLYKREGVEVKE